MRSLVRDSSRGWSVGKVWYVPDVFLCKHCRTFLMFSWNHQKRLHLGFSFKRRWNLKDPSQFTHLLRHPNYWCYKVKRNLALLIVMFLKVCLFILKWYYDQKSFPFFPPILKVYSLNIQLAKFWALRLFRRLFILSVSFGFDGPPLLTFKTDR